MSAPERVRFTRAHLEACAERHRDDEGRVEPRLGCPVCFLVLVYSQPLVDLGAEAAELAAAEGNRAALTMLERFRGLYADVTAHHLMPEPAAAPEEWPT